MRSTLSALALLLAACIRAPRSPSSAAVAPVAPNDDHDEPAMAEALVAAGAVVTLDIVHMKGLLPHRA